MSLLARQTRKTLWRRQVDFMWVGRNEQRKCKKLRREKKNDYMQGTYQSSRASVQAR